MFDPFLILKIFVFWPFLILTIVMIIISVIGMIVDFFPFSGKKQSRHDLSIGESTAVVCVVIVGFAIGIYTSETLMWLFFIVVNIAGFILTPMTGPILSSKSKIDEKPISKIDKKPRGISYLASVERKIKENNKVKQ